ncbi:homeobox protein HOX1A isoform X2 [Diospyros lotus]|uniref:homeobox protein HOX1A isoform X2 n=1 Tax=Diospyros lotus TaxID=55363 RepID=UPI002259C939|nr:homeobox protein HOX1A isoform X2 [Diospyros lotus]
MDVPSAQEKSETGQGSNPRKTASIQELLFDSKNLSSQPTEEKVGIGTENINKDLAGPRTANCDCTGIEQIIPLQEDSTKNSNCEQFGQLEVVVPCSNPDQLSLLSEAADGKEISARQVMEELNDELGYENLSDTIVGKNIHGIANIHGGPAEAEIVEPSHFVLEQHSPPLADVNRNSMGEQLTPHPEDDRKSGLEEVASLPEDETASIACEQLEALPDNEPKNVDEQLEQLPDNESNNVEEQLGLLPDSESKKVDEQLEPLPGDESKNVDEQMEQFQGDESKNVDKHMGQVPEHESKSVHKQLELLPDNESKNVDEQLEPLPDNESKNVDNQLESLPDNKSESVDASASHEPLSGQLELQPEDAARNPRNPGGKYRRSSAKLTEGKSAHKSSVDTTRVLRSRLREKTKALEPSDNLTEHADGADGEKQRKNSKKRQMKKISVNEFSRIRTHLRYLLHRMSYEQNLIDAYSGEGWKGQSLEKIKPEKELQRAKSEIFRCKLKIRDLFQRLDLSIAEGRLPASLFDSEGQIDSEDIFCAKCGSKDLPADNDIILCDGACERGFHQFCLEPPLLKEDIPPGDEGWLCPGCDCKVDCIGLLNDSQGTSLSVLDTWEKVFPEAASAAAGNKLDDFLGLPSDDSEDNDYDPDGSEVDEKVEGDELGSDESDFYSASEGFGASPDSKQNFGLSSDDSEDDDYDPNAPDLDEQLKPESSSSDFTSDSEDFGVAFDNIFPGKNEPTLAESMAASAHTKPHKGFDGERSNASGRNKQSLNEELFSLLQSDPGQEDSAPVSGKRNIERLDYKKLYDETFGDVTCNSSDEDWMDAAEPPKKRRNNGNDKVVFASSGEKTPVKQGTNAEAMNLSQEDGEHALKRRAHKRLDVEATNNSPGSDCNSTKKSPFRRLGEATTQVLLKSFKENQYPERATKENLSKELGITVSQVSKWFENARWSFRHHPSRLRSNMVENVENEVTPPQTNLSESGSKMATESLKCNGAESKELNIVNSSQTTSTQVSSRQRSRTPRGCKRKSQSDHQASEQLSSSKEATKLSEPIDKPKAQASHKSSRRK